MKKYVLSLDMLKVMSKCENVLNIVDKYKSAKREYELIFHKK